MDLLGPRDSFTLQRDVRRSVSRLSEKHNETLVTDCLTAACSTATQATTINDTPTVDVENTTQAMERTITPGRLEAAISDPNSPRDWSRTKKIAITAFVLASTFIATLGAPIYIASIAGVSQHFSTNPTLATSPTSLYAFGLAFGALLGSACSEVFGRVVVYRISLPLAFAFTLIAGSAQHFWVLAVGRSFAGLFSGPCLSIGVSVIDDLWDVKGRLIAVVGCVLVVGWANMAGPMISSAILHTQTWRWTFWIHALLLGILAVHAFIIPETYSLRSLAQNSPGQEPAFRLLRKAVGRPLHMLVTEAIVFATGLGMAITQATLYAYYTTYPLLFSQIYHKDQYSASLAFTPILIGSLVSLPILWTFDHFTYRRTRLSGAVLAAEKRLVPALLGVVLMPISLFWLAFIGTSNIPSLVPQASGLLFGMAYMFNMIPLVMYNNDVYGTRGLAACVFVWFSVSASFPLFMGGLMEGMGFRWAVCVLGFVAVAMIPVPWVLWRLGERLRVRSWYLKGDEGLGSAVVRL